MERNTECVEKAVALYEQIKPLVRYQGRLIENSNLKKDDMFSYDWTWPRGMWLYFKEYNEIEISTLSVLADIKVLYPMVQNEPYVGDILLQIPEEMLDKTKYFCRMYSAGRKGDKDIFKKEFEEGYAVAVIRLFQEKNENSKQDNCSLGIYPDKEAALPIGMTEDEFEGLKKLIEKRFR